MTNRRIVMVTIALVTVVAVSHGAQDERISNKESVGGLVEIAGHWEAFVPRTVIGTGEFRQLRIDRKGQKYFLTIIRGDRARVGVQDGRLIFRDTRIETGPYRLDGSNGDFSFLDVDGSLRGVRLQQSAAQITLWLHDEQQAYYRRPSN